MMLGSQHANAIMALFCRDYASAYLRIAAPKDKNSTYQQGLMSCGTYLGEGLILVTLVARLCRPV